VFKLLDVNASKIAGAGTMSDNKTRQMSK